MAPKKSTSSSKDTNNYSEIVACLKFLANEELNKNNLGVVAVLKHSISEIDALHDPTQCNYTLSDCSQILLGFRLVAKYCLIDDPYLKKAFVRYYVAKTPRKSIGL